ncbi:hypothetical protein CSHISOI_02516 [Colletotrichum shisoi]|uniref:DUF4604 domain-containing protein n=1 Tax=Colletotrichum shisoi TaxID=2078593 RepID=A0A5Q4C256_9PEZI|nr:hypothetical protein CSHISOI_02516 [Colletotrichum shisoi]
MSDKITSKNLSYDTTIPPFLRALHAQAAGNAADPDPILSKRRRAGKKRSESEEAEDAPLVVDDEGNVVDVRVDKDGGVDESALQKDGEVGDETGAGREESRREAEKLAGIGASKKKKAGKLVGGDAAEDADDKDASNNVKKESKEDENGKKKVGKKKGKKIKLSFDPE